MSNPLHRLPQLMLTSDALALLDRHQRHILDQIAAARGLLVCHPQAEREELAKVRWQLLRLLRAYQLFKHVEIFDPVIASAHPARQPVAHRLKAACIAAGEGYRAYTVQWSSADIERDRATYADSALAMAGSLERHLAAERVAIAALLADMNRTRKA